MHKCSRCKVKWAQRAGFCRRCGREEGVFDHPSVKIDLAMLTGEVEALAPQQQPRKTISVRGVEYEVMWP